MKALTAVLAVLAATSVASASIHDPSAMLARHAKIGHRDVRPLLNKRADGSRCRERPLPTKTPEQPVPETPENPGNNGGNNNNGGGNNNTGGGNKTPNSVPFNRNGGGYAGSCSDKHATAEITPISGPNGGEDWLNCGLTGSGWNPPTLTIADIVTVPLDVAIQQEGTPYTACKPFLEIFDEMGAKYGLPPIMIAAFAMQESSCNPNTQGQGGEQGLMQITQEKCQGRSLEACREPRFNIETGAAYFAGRIQEFGGNVLLALGGYNGWRKGLTEGQARAAAGTSCCYCQNNMDYLMQWMNGWILNHNVYHAGNELGRHKNLLDCPSH